MEAVVKDLLPGTKYILQARSKGANGVTSQWSNTFKVTTESDTTAPSPISGLSWVVNRSAFVGTWTKPTTDSNGKPLKDFNGYEITVTANSISKKFISMQERFDLSFEQNVASFTTPQPVVQISIKTRDIVGNLSTAVTATATNPAPANVTNFVGVGFPLAIQLNWDQSTEDDFKAFEIYHSTSGSGFTPGPGNMLTTTGASAFIFPTSSFVDHFFKIRQVDVFNQGSASYALVTAQPLNTTGIDITAPNAPSAVTVATVSDSSGTSHIDVSWTASGSSNLAEYLVRYSTDQVTWRYVTVPSNQTIAQLRNLEPNTNYYVGIAAVSFVSSYSAWVNASVGGYPILTAKDTTAPSTPSAPSVSFNTQTVQVSHGMTKAAGGNLESDVRYLEVHGSTTNAFTASSATLIGTLDAAGTGITAVGSFPVPVTTSVTNMYWRVIAVDYAGNKSTQSAQATGVPGLIQGANISDATIDNAKINNLSAAKLMAGTAFINNLSIQSQLTLDAATGYIASTNFSIPSKTGWRLDQNGLVIYDGSIAAKSLLLQNGNNIALPPFADFEFNESYYHDTSNAVVATAMTATSGMLLAMQYTGVKVGKQSLRLWNTAITGSTVHKLHFATDGDSATGVNIDLNPGDYIFSIWAKKNGSVDQTLKLGLYPDTGSAIESAGIPVTSTSWTRYSAVLTVPSGVSKVKQYISLQAVTTGYDLVIDALQLEPKLTAETTPSAWKPPSTTVIDGGSIITGSIRSSAASATVPGQPAWSINTAGNMQIGDALVRGKLTMGVAADQKNLLPRLYASFEDAASNYYNVSNNIPNSGNFTLLGTNNSNIKFQQSTAGTPPHGTYGLRTWATSGLLASNFYNVLLGSANLYLIPGQQYIVSAYIKNNDATKGTKAGIGVYNSTNGFTIGMTTSTITTSYVRYSAVITGPSNAYNTFYFAVQTQAGETAFDVSWDAIQIETAPVGVTTPSVFTDGTIGLSSMASANYTTGQTGWSINSDGTVEFNAATIRGQLVVTGTSGNIKTDLSGSYPTIFFNGNDGSQAFINAAAGGSSKALLGLNSASYTQGSNSVRPRVWMPDQIRIEQVDETASAAAGTSKFYGGKLILDKTSSRWSLFNSSNVEQSAFNLGGSFSSVGLQTFDNSANEISFLYQDSTQSIWGRKTSGGSLLGQIGIYDTFMSFGTQGDFVRYEYAKNAFVHDSGWSDITLQNGWIPRGSTWPNPGYRKMPDGTVLLRGQMKNGITSDGTWIGTLPSGYRPPVEDNFVISSFTGSNDAILAINTNGEMYIFNIGGSPLTVGLGGVRFSIH